jgi:Raf kinase inhibitor-like YbhB/YbcL family protein
MAKIVDFGRIRSLWFCALVFIALSSCQRKNQNAPTNQAGPTAIGSESPIEQTGGEKMTITVSSTAFRDGGMIPSQYACDGPNISPPIEWAGLPTDAETIALICDDPDAPAKVWVHWVVFDVPATRSGLPEAVPSEKTIPDGGRQGTNDFGEVGYGGPCPPSGTHRYYFKVYALDTQLNLDSTTTKDRLLRAMEGHVLAQGQLIGGYRRTG